MAIYQSQYTGKQIDEAVAKQEVMAEQIEDAVENQKAMAEQIEKNHQIAIRNSKQIENFKQGWSDQFETDSSVAYVKNVPDNALPYAEVKKIGGMTYKDGDVLRSASVTEGESVGVNLIPFPYSKTSQTISGVTFSVNGDGTIQINGTANLDIYFFLNEVEYSAGEHYCLSGCPSGGGENTYMLYDDVNYKKDFGDGITFSYPKTTTGNIYIYISSGVTVSNLTFNPMLNRGSTAKPHTPYQAHTLAIPKAVRALDGYGLGVSDAAYNYVDLEKKQFVKKCPMVDLGTLAWEIGSLSGTFVAPLVDAVDMYYGGGGVCSKYDVRYSNDNKSLYTTKITTDAGCVVVDSDYADAATFKAAMSGVMLVYELAEPEITDISDLITADNLIEVEGGGTLTFKNEYEYAVPSEVEYQVEV